MTEKVKKLVPKGPAGTTHQQAIANALRQELLAKFAPVTIGHKLSASASRRTSNEAKRSR